MDFRERLQRATQRGIDSRSARQQEEAAAQHTEAEYRSSHSALRLALGEHIEQCLHQLADEFPGFRYETIVDDRGWGGAVVRDDLQLDRGRRGNSFSRMQVVVAPFNEYHVLELGAKGTVRNKENFTRTHYQHLDSAKIESFQQLLERWVLEYAEQYAAS